MTSAISLNLSLKNLSSLILMQTGKEKGTFKAIERFEYFARKVSKGFTRTSYILKVDIRHYFDTVDHEILYSILEPKIKDEKLMWFIKVILKNHKTQRQGR